MQENLYSDSPCTLPPSRLHPDSIPTPLDDRLDDRPGDRQLNPNESEPYMLRYNYLL